MICLLQQKEGRWTLDELEGMINWTMSVTDESYVDETRVWRIKL